jgi:hypothetical protein
MALLLQVLLDMQLSSMKAYTPPNFGQDPSLHFITQRYAMLTTSLLLLNADYQVRRCQPCTQPLVFAQPCTIAQPKALERACCFSRVLHGVVYIG